MGTNTQPSGSTSISQTINGPTTSVGLPYDQPSNSLPAASLAVLANSGVGLPLVAAFTTSIDLSGNRNMGRRDVTGALTFTPAASPAVGGSSYLRLVANGVDAPVFSGFKEWGGSSGWNNTAGILNSISFFYDGADYYYSVAQAIGVQPIGPVRLTVLAGVTESGSASTGWNYAGNGTNTAFTGSQAGSSALKIASGADGYFQATIGAWNGAAQGPYLGLRTTSSISGSYSSCVLGIYIADSSGYALNTGVTGAQVPDVPTLPAVGDIVRLRRAGSTVYAEISRNNGDTFTIIKTWTGITTADLYPMVILPLASARADAIRGLGVI